MKDITSYPDSIEVKECADKISKLFSDWKKDPRHWRNNKRKLHGYCVLRGKANRKDRFQPPRSMVHELTAQLGQKVDQLMTCVLPDIINDTINQFVDIHDVNIGTTYHQFEPFYLMQNTPDTNPAHHGLFDDEVDSMQVSHGTAPWDKFGWSRDGWGI